MLSVEQTLAERLPWLASRPVIRRPLASVLSRLADERGFNAALTRAGPCAGLAFVDHALEGLGVGCRVDLREREHIPAEGPLLVVANHPLGMVDALAVLQLVGSVREDVRILANDWLGAVKPLQPLLLPVNVFGGAASSLRGVYRAFARGEAVVIFPAGEVSRVRGTGVRDGRWAEGFARLALRKRIPVLPVHVAARNSLAFYGLSLLARPLGTAMLPREAASPSCRCLTLRVGALVAAEELERRSGGSPRRAANLMRRHVYRIGGHRRPLFEGQAALAHPESAARVAGDLLAHGEKLADLADGKQIFLLPGAADGALIRELGRLRELTFRQVGEGTGRRRDIDACDAYYEHLVLWDPAAVRIVGAYRLGDARRILLGHGVTGLYTASLFDYAPAFVPTLAQGVELGRSFIAQAYWRSRALDQLWQGIGLYLARRPHVRYLFGPVSLSASLPREAREWIVAAHRHYFGKPGLAAARRPFVVPAVTLSQVEAHLGGLDCKRGLNRLRHHLDALGASLPVLYRRYVDLVEPQGVRFLDFGEDPAFSGCVDGLVMLDLAHVRPAMRQRYLQGSEPKSA